MKYLLILCTLAIAITSCSDEPQPTEVTKTEFQTMVTNRIWKKPENPAFFNGKGEEVIGAGFVGEQPTFKGLYITDTEFCIFEDSPKLGLTWISHSPYTYDETTGVLTAGHEINFYARFHHNTIYIESVSEDELIIHGDFGCLTKLIQRPDGISNSTDTLSYGRYVYTRVPESEENEWWDYYHH